MPCIDSAFPNPSKHIAVIGVIAVGYLIGTAVPTLDISSTWHQFLMVSLGGIASIYCFMRGSTSVSVRQIFLLMIFLFPLTKGLTLRIGAQWELYLFLALILLSWALLKGIVLGRNGIDHNIIMAFMFFTVSIISSSLAYVIGDYIPTLTLQQTEYYKSAILLLVVENIRLLACVSVFAVTLLLVRNRDTFFRAIRIFVYGATMEACIGIYEMVTKVFSLPLPFIPDTKGEETLLRSAGTMYEPSQYGSFLLIAVFLNWMLINQNKYDKLLWVTLVLILVGFVFSFSLTAMVVGSVGLLILLGLTRKVSVFVVRTIVLLLLGLFVYEGISSVEGFSLILDNRIQRIVNADMANSLVQRVNAGFRINDWMLMNPILGIGQGIAVLYSGMLPMAFRIPTELGILGTIFMILICLSAFVGVWQVRKVDMLKKFFPFLLATYVTLLGVSFNYNTSNDGWIWFVLALFVSLKNVVKEQKASPA